MLFESQLKRQGFSVEETPVENCIGRKMDGKWMENDNSTVYDDVL